jgi:hypothetical protein
MSVATFVCFFVSLNFHPAWEQEGSAWPLSK